MPVPKRQTQREPPWENGAEKDPVSFGTWLRRQREIREIPLREIADVTKISIRYLEALEQDRFDVLPAPVFAKGFLREYSKYVGVDPDEVVNTYLLAQQEMPEAEEPTVETSPVRPRKGPPGILLLALGIAIAAGLIAALFYYNRYRQQSAPTPEPPAMAAPVVSAAPEAAPASSPEPTSASPLVVILDFTEDCWVEVEVDGERRLSELHVQGESMRLEAQERVLLTMGNPGGVRVEVNGRPYGLDFAQGQVARDLDITLETVRQLESSAE